MKAQILFDQAGNVISVLQLPSDVGSGKGPVASLRPRVGQQVATLEIPSELRHLSVKQLHAAVYVDRRSGTPHIAAKPKAISSRHEV